MGLHYGGIKGGLWTFFAFALMLSAPVISSAARAALDITGAKSPPAVSPQQHLQNTLILVQVDEVNSSIGPQWKSRIGGLRQAAEEMAEMGGTLAPNKIYGFVPALMLGGPASLANLQRLKADVHLILLSQLAELEPCAFDDEEDE
ncbi:T6SS immunity protein Tdi1 domain-containing protein [Pseudomonas sp. 382]|uniref:T6SS immunity protein Tdi1 domain-containing protein n=3 Tax=Pseudomonas TaxID=286 RepID=UPI0035312341